VTSIWGKRRRAAREAGQYHAQGGPDTRAAWTEKHCAEAYAAGYDEQMEYFNQQQTRQTAIRDHPLTQIKHEADALAYRSDNSEVTELARLIERMAEYIMEQEGDGK